jgi:hypothetical protein
MRDINSTDDIEQELSRVVAYMRNAEHPSRSRIASDLNSITRRLERSAASLADLKDSIYNTPVKLKGYNIRPTVTQAHGADAGKVLIQLAPEMTKSQHASLAREFEALADKLEKEWGEVADEAAQATWGRDFRVTDYRVSGIGSDEFSDEYKDKLRISAHGTGKARAIAAAHEAASKSRMLGK